MAIDQAWGTSTARPRDLAQGIVILVPVEIDQVTVQTLAIVREQVALVRSVPALAIVAPEMAIGRLSAAAIVRTLAITISTSVLAMPSAIALDGIIAIGIDPIGVGAAEAGLVIGTITASTTITAGTTAAGPGIGAATGMLRWLGERRVGGSEL